MSTQSSTQTGYAPVENGSLYYEVTGEGPALLFIHAGVADHTMWEPQVDFFSPTHKVITYDTRGFGISRTENTPFSNRQDIFDLLNHIGVDRATLIGNSRGGQIALDTALEFPVISSGLVWICGGVSGADFPPTEAEMAWFGRMEALWEAKDWDALSDYETLTWANGIGQPEDRAPAALRTKLREMIYSNNTRVDGEAEARVLDPPAAARIKELTIPTLVVVGDRDASSTIASADYLAAEVPQARKVVFENVAHMVSMEKPEDFNALLQDFLTNSGL
ncbi:MAG: alpha/beta hydrolase [Chloroflexota bacterium]